MSYGVKLKTVLKQVGYFIGNFFGINDEWNINNTRKTFFTKEQVLVLFDNFEIISFDEIEKDGTTRRGKTKALAFL